MKIGLTVSMLLLFKFAYPQQVDLINEDFNNGFPSNWTHYYSSWDGEQWAIDSGALRENSGPYFVQKSNWIELPAVDMTTVANPILSFDLAMAVTNPNISFSVSYKTDSIWHNLISYADTSTAISIYTSHDNNWRPSSMHYQTISVNLMQFDNEPDITFRFVYDYLNSHASGVWYIDNVKISGDSPASITDYSEPSSFQLYPNPASDVIRFVSTKSVKHATLTISNITGGLLLKKVIDSDIEVIDVSNYPPGIYFINYTEKDKVFTEKLIVR